MLSLAACGTAHPRRPRACRAAFEAALIATSIWVGSSALVRSSVVVRGHPARAQLGPSLDFVQAIKILAFISHDIFQSLWGGACAGSNRIADLRRCPAPPEISLIINL
jgi:hypothetical protein